MEAKDIAHLPMLVAGLAFALAFVFGAVANKVNAEFKDGVLRVTLAKREEAKPKQIEVKVK